MNSASDNLALEFVRVTEVAAIAAAKWIGKGDAHAADAAAVDAMRAQFNTIDFRGTIVIGEGAKDEAAELYVGEAVGSGSGAEYDIAVDPLECTDSVANGRPNAIAVIATGPKGSLYRAADSYMEKIAVGAAAKGVIDIDAPHQDNIRKVAKALGKDVSEVTVATLDRERHASIVAAAREVGARVRLFSDGDVAMAMATCMPDSSVDILLGTGGSAEAVLAAAAMRCLDGEILCRWKPKDEKHIARLAQEGVTDFSQIFRASDLAKSDEVTFTATGIVSGLLAEGVVFGSENITTHSVVLSRSPHAWRTIITKHIK